MEMTAEYLPFDAFCEAVGASPNAVRNALKRLGIDPVNYDLSDLRKLGYPVARIGDVRQDILDNLNRK